MFELGFKDWPAGVENVRVNPKERWPYAAPDQTYRTTEISSMSSNYECHPYLTSSPILHVISFNSYLISILSNTIYPLLAYVITCCLHNRLVWENRIDVIQQDVFFTFRRAIRMRLQHRLRNRLVGPLIHE